jgi:hypothetical protein
MMELRKHLMVIEEIGEEAGYRLMRPVRRVAGIVVVANPCAGRASVDDLSSLFDLGAEAGDFLMKRLADLLGAPAVSYGKGAIVGTAGEMEHGAACVHPRLGKPMRAAVGGGQALIPSNVKVAAAGTAIDVPLGHKDDPWSFDHFDTMTLSVPDAPRPDELLIAMAIADGGRPRPRCGKGRIL